MGDGGFQKRISEDIFKNMNTLQCTFHNPSLFDEFFYKMRDLRTDKSNCDICLNVNGSKIYAHRNVLACGTPYFFNMFYGVFPDRDKSEITIDQIGFEALEDIVNYFYSREIKITEQNVKKLFQASDRILVDFIKKKCIGVICQITNTTNCFDFWDFAESVNCDNIRLGVFDFIFKNFEDVIKTEEFLNLSYNQIYTITVDKVFKRNPKGIYTGVLRWVKHNLKVRQQHFYDLIKSIEFKNIDKGFIKTYVSTEDLMKNDHNCLLILTEILFFHAYPEEKKTLTGSEWTDVIEKKLQPCIYVLSSVQDQHKSLTQIYNPYIEYIKLVKPTNIERNFTGITCQKGVLYIVGGRTEAGFKSKDCNVYNIAKNEWSKISSLLCGLDLNALVSHGDRIYAMGSAVRGAQIYDPALDVWKLTESPFTSQNVFGEKCTADVIGDRIYVVSSRSIFGDVKSIISSIKALDPRSENWEMLAPSPSFGFDVSSAVIDNKLYISWTEKNNSYLSEFDVRSQKLIPLANMNSTRPCHDLIKYNERLYAIGGKNISTVEEYDIENNCWTYVNSIKGSFAYVQAVVPDYDS